MTDNAVPFGPTGRTVYERTYSRTLADGSKETWPDTVRRVAAGNLALVHGTDQDAWSADVRAEYDELVAHMDRFAILPAGRHLWATGVKGRQFLFNCHVSGWGTERLSRHYEFTFLRLMEGGGVGANYSSRFLQPFGAPRRELRVHIVCDPMHQDYEEMKAAGVLSEEYDSDWAGAFEVEDSREGWADALVDLIDTFMTDRDVRHADRVYDVSRVRCKGSRLKTFGGTASGPQPFARMMIEIARVLSGVHAKGRHLSPVEAMEIEHRIAECVVSGGVRRSARMSICHWADPFITEFLSCKQDTALHWTTNVSVEIDSEFIDALNAGREDAVAVHQAVVAGALTNGEPGYWNSTYSNEGEVNEVIATNPCGEIALPSAGACVLGHVNLDAFAPKTRAGSYDRAGVLRAHELMTRFLIRATYGDMTDDEQRGVMHSERRIGVGHFGVQGFLAKMGIRYSEAPYDPWFRTLLEDLYDTVREQAREYAFSLRVPEPVKVTTMAPTGTIAKMPGVTEGGHAIYGRHFNRRIRFSMLRPEEVAQAQDFMAQGFHVEKCVYDQSGNTMVVTIPTKDKLVAEVEAMGYPADLVESQDELSLHQLLAFQAMYQECYADNAVSFTANVPEGLDPDEVARTIQAWLPDLKGTTIMVDGTRPQAPYERITAEEFAASAVTSIEDSTDEDCATGACPVR
ncbi:MULTISPECIES: ribonucleoside-triphosphate reductase, adenosylcobalamin-dependent [Streptomyces]|uniref:ribonucleoside-triphosphate reductase, adenosylcobalamin-dependent n=1 Tax=Streptomyces TaxID=1883 RepID=UPI0036A73B33